MHLQKVQNPPLNPPQGALLVAGIVAVMYLASAASTWLFSYLGALAQLGFYALGILVALLVMRRFLLSYSYALNQNLLRLSHVYGKHERLIEDLYLTKIVSAGAPETVIARYPQARIQRCTLTTCPLEPLAVAWRDGADIRIALLQPDDVIRERLTAAAMENRR